jgi:hypothetical protein
MLRRSVSHRLFPPLPAELVEFSESGLSIQVATRDAALRPSSTRAVGVRVWPGASQLTVFLAAATSASCVADLRDNGKLALTLSLPATHETIQIKGTAREVRQASDDDGAFIERYREQFARRLVLVGLPSRIVLRLACWPAFAVDLDIAEVFAQTPGPGAGQRMSSP